MLGRAITRKFLKEGVSLVALLQPEHTASHIYEKDFPEVKVIYSEMKVSLLHKDEIGEEDELTARKFLIEHESEKELIPLCQVAFLSNPNHKHIRPMYNEFLVLPSKVRKIILDTCEQVATIQVLHTNEALDLFCKDLEEYGL